MLKGLGKKGRLGDPVCQAGPALELLAKSENSAPVSLSPHGDESPATTDLDTDPSPTLLWLLHGTAQLHGDNGHTQPTLVRNSCKRCSLVPGMAVAMVPQFLLGSSVSSPVKSRSKATLPSERRNLRLNVDKKSSNSGNVAGLACICNKVSSC